MSATVSRFRPGYYQRGEETRSRILEAALELFAASGFEGASTRTIAERAGVNLPAIQYYFGSKEGLYRAVVEQFSQEMQAGVSPIAAMSFSRAMMDAYSVPCAPETRASTGPGFAPLTTTTGMSVAASTPAGTWR